jgi:hypothetical protein
LGHVYSARYSKRSSESIRCERRAWACGSSLALDAHAHPPALDAAAAGKTLPGIVYPRAKLRGERGPCGDAPPHRAIPLAGYGCSVNRSVFTWFLTSAPAAALASLSVPEAPSLGRILIDTALVTSKALGLDGQMWLHAAPGGGARLAHFYGTICHMPAFPAGMALPGRRRSDGRHYYATRSLANQLVQALKLVR